MFDKIRDFCDIKFCESKIDIGYYIALFLYFTLQIGLFIVFGKMFDNWYFIITGSIITNLINNYSYTHHCHKLENCIIMTQIFFILFGYLAKIISIEWSLLFAILSIKEIYLNAPIKLTHENKSRDWHLYKIITILMVILALIAIGLYFGLYIIVNNILWAVIMTNILMIENKLERV